jgi:hypothetical protein
VLDRCTADNLKHALSDIVGVVPELDRLARKCQLSLQLSTTDRFPANFRCEKAIQAEDPSCKWVKCHLPCDVHKVSTSQGSQFELLSSHVSSMLNLGLSMTPAQSTASMRSALERLFEAKLRVIYSVPPEGDTLKHRLAVLDLFLSLQNSSAGKRALPKLQRAIISFFLNGDIQNEISIEHYCAHGCCVDHDDTLRKIKQWLVPCLLPFACPILARARWLGSDRTIDWCGLLASHHNILGDLLSLWHGVPAKPAHKGQDEQDDGAAFVGGVADVGSCCSDHQPDASRAARDASSEQHGGNNGVPLLAASDVRPDQSSTSSNVDAAQTPGAPEDQAVPPAASTFDWAEFQKKVKQDAVTWAAGGVAHILVAMRICMQPLLHFMLHLLYMTSKEWHVQQLQASAEGKPRKFKPVEVCKAAQDSDFIKEIVQLMQSSPPAIPDYACLKSTGSLMFRLLARGAAAGFQLVIVAHRGYPYKLFLALLGDEFTDEILMQSCQFDELATAICGMFPLAADMSSPKCQAILSCIASFLEIDNAAIEGRHASTRRVIVVRSAQTHAVSLEMISAEWASQQFRICKFEAKHVGKTPALIKRYIQQERKKAKQEQRIKKDAGNKNKPKRKRKDGGGPWRAFVHVHLAGRKATSESFKECSEAYRSLSEEELKSIREIGSLGKHAYQRGFNTFGAKLPPANPQPQLHHRQGQSQIPNTHFQDLVQTVGDLADSASIVHDSVLTHRSPVDNVRALVKSARQQFKRTGVETCQKGEATNAVIAAFIGSPSAPQFHKSIFPSSASAQIDGFQPVPATVPAVSWCPPADACTKAALSGPRLQSGLRVALENAWERMHRIYRHDEAQPIGKLTGCFKVKPCAVFGMCVCTGVGQEALFFHQRLAPWMKSVFFKKSKPRQWLDSAHVVLGFFKSAPQCDTEVDPAAPDEISFPASSDVEPIPAPMSDEGSQIVPDPGQPSNPDPITQPASTLQVGCFQILCC